MTDAAPSSSGPDDPKWSVPALKAKARHAVDPLLDRMRHEVVVVAEAAAEPAQAGLRAEQDQLRTELAELKDLVLRTRAEHAAELAALHEELAASHRA